MKLFYWVDPASYEELLERVARHFSMHREVDEEKTILRLDDTSKIEQVTASYDPGTDRMAHVSVVINDTSLREFFDSVFGIPYRVR